MISADPAEHIAWANDNLDAFMAAWREIAAWANGRGMLHEQVPIPLLIFHEQRNANEQLLLPHTEYRQLMRTECRDFLLGIIATYGQYPKLPKVPEE